MIELLFDYGWVDHPSPLQSGSGYFMHHPASERETGDESGQAGLVQHA